MSSQNILDIDPIIHAPIRLAVLSILAAAKEAQFTYLKEAVNASDGNLSTHLTKLEDAGYIKIEKTFKGKKPQTTCAITEKGRKAFVSYVDNLEKLINLKKGDS